MHPADQFDAFFALHNEHGVGAEDIAARFGVTAAVVRQRLKLAAVSAVLLQAYRDEKLSLDQLTAFAVTDDHLRQEKVWEQCHGDEDRADILAMLNEKHVATDDRRAVFVGVAAYIAAGGAILRDLFDEESEGFLTDPDLLNQLVEDKLEAVAGTRRRFAFVVEVRDELPPEGEVLAWASMFRTEPPPGWTPCGASVSDFAIAAARCKMLGLADADALAAAVVRARDARLGPGRKSSTSGSRKGLVH